MGGFFVVEISSLMDRISKLISKTMSAFTNEIILLSDKFRTDVMNVAVTESYRL